MERTNLIKVYVVDPSLFSIPYDIFFCDELSARPNVQVTLFGRSLRPVENLNLTNAAFYPYFYRLNLSRVSKVFKGLEHLLYMTLFTFRCIRYRPHVIHFQWTPIPIVDAFFIRVLRSLTHSEIYLTAHNSTPFHGEGTSNLQSYGWNFLLKSFDRIQVHNDITKSRLVANDDSGTLEGKIFKAHHGPLSNTLIAENIFNKDFDFCMFGNIKRYKGVGDYLDALVILFERGVNFKALLVGSGVMTLEEKQKSSILVERNILTVVNQFVSDSELDDYIRKAKYTVFPYREIDGSGALALSLSLGVIPLISDLDGLKEVLGKDYKFIFGVENPISLASIMEEALLSDSYRNDNLAISSAFLKKFSWASAIELLIGEYSKGVKW